MNHHLDSSRWEVYKPRQNDVVVTTSYKCGTTFTQQILYNLLVANTFDEEVFPPIGFVSPWVDARFIPMPVRDLAQFMDSLPDQRFLKSHLPLDGLPYFPEVKYIIVARDPRDVFVSLLNHYGAYTDFMFEQLNNQEGKPMPRFDGAEFGGDIRKLWRAWISKGWFEWEQEGYPFWSNMHHTQSYWEFRHLPNFMFLHYADMISDTSATVRRIADFIERPVDDGEVESIVQAVSFKRVKEQAKAESARHSDMPEAFAGGQDTFINKGTNGRWHDVLNSEDLQLYEEAKQRVLSSECAAWLETGGLVAPN